MAGLFDSLTEEAGYITSDGFADANQFVEMNEQLSANPFRSDFLSHTKSASKVVRAQAPANLTEKFLPPLSVGLGLGMQNV
eukprot:9043394-Pyramimonas_sp.AAC.1